MSKIFMVVAYLFFFNIYYNISLLIIIKNKKKMIKQRNILFISLKKIKILI
jgi:hypothetical protein